MPLELTDDFLAKWRLPRQGVPEISSKQGAGKASLNPCEGLQSCCKPCTLPWGACGWLACGGDDLQGDILFLIDLFWGVVSAPGTPG